MQISFGVYELRHYIVEKRVVLRFFVGDGSRLPTRWDWRVVNFLQVDFVLVDRGPCVGFEVRPGEMRQPSGWRHGTDSLVLTSPIAMHALLRFHWEEAAVVGMKEVGNDVESVEFPLFEGVGVIGEFSAGELDAFTGLGLLAAEKSIDDAAADWHVEDLGKSYGIAFELVGCRIFDEVIVSSHD